MVATGRGILSSNGCEAVLARIAVHADHRRRGLGRKVVQRLEEIAQFRGASKVSLTPLHYLQDFLCADGISASCR